MPTSELPAKASLAAVVSKRMRRSTFFGGVVLALLIGVVVGIGSIFFQAAHQTAMLESVRRNVMALAQNSDEREIERVLHSFMATFPNGDIKFIRKGLVRVSVPDIQGALREYSVPRLISIRGITLGLDGSVYSQVDLSDEASRIDFGRLVLKVSGLVPFVNAAILSVLSFCFILLLLAYWRSHMETIVASEMRPLRTLHEDIAAVGHGRSPSKTPDDFDVAELSDIASLIQKQHRDVTQLTEVAVQAEGDRRAKESIQALLHDFVNVYTAQSTLVQARIRFPEDMSIAGKLSQSWPEQDQQLRDLLMSARYTNFETLNTELCDLREAVRQGVALGATERPEVIELELPEIAVRVRHDARLIKRAVANLVRNSVEEGASKVTVFLDWSSVTVHILDNGPGIPPEKISQLFEGRLKSRKPNGSGIGFRTALRFVRAHGGKITVDQRKQPSIPGAHFKVDLSALEVT